MKRTVPASHSCPTHAAEVFSGPSILGVDGHDHGRGTPVSYHTGSAAVLRSYKSAYQLGDCICTQYWIS